jgi:glucose/arabinose dehydrogenase
VPNPTDPSSVVDPGSTRVLLRIDKPQFNHNGGAVTFGHDGMLYISLGDGGGADDQDAGIGLGGVPNLGHGCTGNGQDLTNPLGDILRIDVDGTNSANGQYGIPANNPFVLGPADAVDEIFCWGLRNPFRISFDTMEDVLYIADVGQRDVEEINIGVSGGNYGWRPKEGTHDFTPNGAQQGYASARDLPEPPDLIDPIAEYDHTDGIAILGGFVYRGTKVPPLFGRYVFGDFARTFTGANGRLFHLDENGLMVEPPLFGQTEVGLAVLGFAQDARGEVYLLANESGVPFGDQGFVLRLGLRVGDTGGDGLLGFPDLLSLLANWGACDGCPEDLDDDGNVGMSDLRILLAAWDPA